MKPVSSLRGVVASFGLALAAGLVCCAVAARARAADTVDVEVRPGDRVRGTLRPADERESFLVAALRGSRIEGVAVRAGEVGPKPALTLLDASGTTVLREGVARTGGAAVKRYRLPATGGVRFRVEGDGTLDGDYRLDVKTAAKTEWSVAGDALLDPGAATTFTFAAPRDARATVSVFRSGRRGLEPLLVDLAGPHGESLPADLAATSKTKDVGVFKHLPSAGEWTVRLRNAGAVAGAWRATVRLSGAAYVRQTVDLRDAAIAGEFGGAQTVVGRIADPAAETLIAGAAGFDLDGVSLQIPSGAVQFPTLVTIRQSEEFFVDDEASAAGTTVRFSPAGAVFAPGATMTLPYDPSSFDDAETELSIVTEAEEGGSQETIAATGIDTGAKTATFPVTHFSKFQPVSRKPRPFRGVFVDVVMRGRVDPDFGGTFSLSMDRLESPTGPRTPRPYVRQRNGMQIRWKRTGAGADADFDATLASGEQLGQVAIVSNTTVRLLSPDEDVVLRRGRDPRLYASLDVEGTALVSHFVFQRTRGDATQGNLRGGWHAIVLELSTTNAASAGVVLTAASQQFELDVGGEAADGDEGAATASAASMTSWRQTFPFTKWTRTTSKAVPKQGTLRPEGGAARLTMKIGRDGPLEDVHLVPVLGGDMLVGTGLRRAGLPEDPATAAVARLVVLVRRDADAAAADIAGQFVTQAMALVFQDRDVGPSTLAFQNARLVRSHDQLRIGLGGTSVAEHTIDGTPFVDGGETAGTFTFTLDLDGTYRVQGGFPGGFVTARRPVLVLSALGADRVLHGMGLPVQPADLGP